jgi:metal-responsive CopG/Arc/MetJ family transcriptional regulator
MSVKHKTHGVTRATEDDVRLVVRIPNDLAAELDTQALKRATSLGVRFTRSDIVRAALRAFLKAACPMETKP